MGKGMLERKRNEGWKDLYGKEREKYYNRNGWGVIAIENMPRIERNLIREIRDRERDIQRQEEGSRIREAKYNKRYREFMDESKIPGYLEERVLRERKKGEGIRALIRMRCGNLEEDNRYWLEEEKRRCVFCKEGKDNILHFIGECRVTMEWFEGLGESVQEIVDRLENDSLDEKKEVVLRKLWNEKERYKRKEEEEKETQE